MVLVIIREKITTWCHGLIKKFEAYIKIPVSKPLNEVALSFFLALDIFVVFVCIAEGAEMSTELCFKQTDCFVHLVERFI